MPIPEQILCRIENNDPTLTELNLSSQYPPLNVDDMRQLVVLNKNTQLQLLILCENEIGDEGAVLLASILSSSNVARTIDVSINNIGNAGAIALLTAPITSLNLAGNHVSDVGVQLLISNHVLHSLIIHDNNLTNGCIPYFLANAQLEEVVLDNNLELTNIQRIQEHINENINKHIHHLATKLVETACKLAPEQRLIARHTVNTIFDEKLGTSLQGAFFTHTQTSSTALKT